MGLVTSVCLDKGGGLAISGCVTFFDSKTRDNTIRLWDLATGNCLRTLSGHKYGVHSVCISADGRWVLSAGGPDGTVVLWELATGRCVRTLRVQGDVYSVFMSADGRWGLSGGDRVCLWDLPTGKCLRTFIGHKYGARCVCISVDGRWVFSGHVDRTLHLWDLETGNCIRTFGGHSGPVKSVSISANGRWGLSGSDDTTVHLWDLATGECLRILQAHTKEVTSIGMRADGRWVISGSNDKTVRLWELDWDYSFFAPTDWDEGARPYLETFLTLHTPYAGTLPSDHGPSEEEVQLALTRRGKPIWTEEDFKQLLYTLGCAGYGWLRPQGVRKKLEEMAANWEGPPPLPGQEQGV